jgi:stage II sporulation protein AA (anti-sigma F factor antagonist)
VESNYNEEDKCLTIKITEEIDECSVQKIRRKVDYEFERYMPKEIIFDFDSVTFMDSAGIGFLIGRYKMANMLGSQLKMANLTR